MYAVDKAMRMTDEELIGTWNALMKYTRMNCFAEDGGWHQIWNHDIGETLDDWGLALNSEIDIRWRSVACPI